MVKSSIYYFMLFYVIITCPFNLLSLIQYGLFVLVFAKFNVLCSLYLYCISCMLTMVTLSVFCLYIVYCWKDLSLSQIPGMFKYTWQIKVF